MKHLFIFIALYILLKPALPLVDYAVNYGYIVAELCMNRDRPELECNGKCYLTNQLADASESELPFAENKKAASSGFQLLFFQEVLTYVFADFAESRRAVNVSLEDHYTATFSSGLFRPPIFS